MLDFGLVSVIMPVFNDEAFVKESIQSVLNQTYQNWELIIIDDHSSDGTAKLVKGVTDKRIRIISNPRNVGAAETRNNGLKIAKGKWICFLDGDDCWLPDKLQTQIGAMVQNHLAFSYMPYYESGENGAISGIVSGPKTIDCKRMRHCNYLGCLSVAFNRETCGIPLVDPSLKRRNDYAMWLQLSRCADCVLIDQLSCVYRIHSNSISHSSKIKLLKWQVQVFKKYGQLSSFSSFFFAINSVLFTLSKRRKYCHKVVGLLFQNNRIEKIE